jgi:hypothetical protein
MDLGQIIKQFQTEKERLDQVIAFFEFRLDQRGSQKLAGETDPNATNLKKNGGKRRRKMTPAERKAVSERMRRYWEDRRKKSP